jgi:hypothetical protein
LKIFHCNYLTDILSEEHLLFLQGGSNEKNLLVMIINLFSSFSGFCGEFEDILKKSRAGGYSRSV